MLDVRNRRLIGVAVASIVLSAAPVLAAETAPDADWSVDVGFLTFPTSGSPEAQVHFQRGVAILHSFGYKQAIEEFRKAQELDPGFAMAYWGEALSYNHIFVPRLDLDSPRETLARLAATPEERRAKAPTEREKDFLSAVEVHFGERAARHEHGDDTKARRIAYMEAMKRMHETYPEDDEVSAFYAVAVIAARGPLDERDFRYSVEAGALMLDLFARNPDHPGAAHYIIHAFDDPVHAVLALPAANRFAEIAGAVSHARHMPSHIFIQRGLWDRVSRSNDSAYQVARDLWQPGDRVNDMTHANDWGHYGDLQRADWKHAQERLEIMDEIVEMSETLDEDDRGYPLARRDEMWARQVLESEQWEVREIDDEARADVLLAVGISAVELDDLARAKEAAKLLEQSLEEGDESPRVSAMRDLLVGRIELARGRERKALEALDSAIRHDDRLGPPVGTPATVKPACELYGEVLLALGRPEQAIERFEQALQRMPNRRLSLRGLARALEAAGHAAEAAAVAARLPGGSETP
ncbi:MAG TPA: tetratricopeptide repeat protein [Thermoanaerobaculia bacterium]|nr:tetratricopeptide repeat protein [Thermoanaerobaculia bacterium]